jgi:hypothetical protein
VCGFVAGVGILYRGYSVCSSIFWFGVRRVCGIGVSLSDEVFEWAERRGARTARVAAARMLLLVCRSVWRNRRPYFDPVHGQA